MNSYNRVTLMGNLTRDPESKQAQSGTSFCTFTIAINRSYQDQNGKTQEEVCFVDIESFGKTAENITKYFSKGKPILIEGRLRQKSWEDKQGQKRTKLLVALEKFEFIGNRDSTEKQNVTFEKPVSEQKGINTQAEDDIPF